MHWKVKTLQSLPLFLSHNRSRKWVSFPPFICVAFPGETVATPPYLCYCRVLQWIMKWIMQMSHNIFILTKVEVHVPVPGIYEYAHILKMAGMCYNLMEMNSNDCSNYCTVLCLVFNLWNQQQLLNKAIFNSIQPIVAIISSIDPLQNRLLLLDFDPNVNLQFIFSGVIKTAGIMSQMDASLGFEEFSLVFCLR